MNALDAMDTAPPPAVKGTISLDDMDTAAPPQVEQPQPSATGQSVEPVSGWAKGWKNFTGHWNLGVGSISKAGAGWQLATNDAMSFEDAQHQVMTDAMVQSQHDSEDYGNIHAYTKMAAQFGGSITEQLPTMGLGAGGAALGAGAALLAGGVAAAPIVLGAAAGGAVVFGSVAAGHAVYDAMQRGVDRTNARYAGAAAGIANAAIAMASGGALGKGVTEAGGMILTSPPVKQMVMESAQRMAGQMGIQIAGGELSALTDSIIKYIATRASASATPYTYEEAKSDMLRATMQTFMMAPALVAGGEFTGALAGRVFKTPIERTNAMKQWFDAESKAIEQKHLQNLMVNANLVAQSNLPTHIKVKAISHMAAQVERAKLVDAAALAAKAKPKANPAAGQAPAMSDNPLENRERLSGFIEKTAQRVAPWSRTFGQPFMTQEGQLAIAFQDAPDMEPLATKLGTSEAVEAVHTYKRDYSAIYNQHMQKATGLTPADVQNLAHKALTDDLTINHTAVFQSSGAKPFGLTRKEFESQAWYQGDQSGGTNPSSGWWSYDPEYAGRFASNRKPEGAVRVRLARDFPSELFQNPENKVTEEIVDQAVVRKFKQTKAVGQEQYLYHNPADDALIPHSAEVPASATKDVYGYLQKQLIEKKQTALHLTAGEAISYLLWSDNQDAQAALFEPFRLSADGTKIGNGFSLDTVAKMKDALHDADPKYLAALDGLKDFYDTMGPILKADHDALTGGNLHLQTNYGGSVYRDGDVTLADKERNMTPLLPGGEVVRPPRFTNQRAASKVFIKPRDAFQNAATRVRQQAQWRGMAEHAPLWNDLISDIPFKTAVDTKFPGLFKAIEQGYVDTIHGFGAEQGNAFFNLVMRARGFRKLAGKVVQTAKHMTTLTNFAMYQFRGKPIPAADFTAGVLDAHAHWGSVVKQLFSWDEVKNRYAEPEKILAGLNSDSMSPRETRIQRAFMKPFELGDQYALIAGTHTVYKYVLKETGDAKIAKTEAVKAFKNFLASGSMDQQGAIMRTDAGKAVGQFKQPEIRLAQNTTEQWRKATNNPTPQNIANAVRTHMLSSIAAALFVLPETVVATGIGAVVGNNSAAAEQQFRMWQRFQLGNVYPIIGDFLTNTHTAVTNYGTELATGENPNHNMFEFTVAPFDSIESAAKLIGDAAHWAEGKGTVHLIWKTALDAIGATNAPVPEALPRGGDALTQLLGVE